MRDSGCGPNSEVASIGSCTATTSVAMQIPTVGTLSGQQTPTHSTISRSANEAVLLRMLLSGPHPQRVQLSLCLPREFVQGILVKQGFMRAIAARSGSKLELGTDHAGAATQLVTITGPIMGNSMAILHIQEKLLQGGI